MECVSVTVRKQVGKCVHGAINIAHEKLVCPNAKIHNFGGDRKCQTGLLVDTHLNCCLIQVQLDVLLFAPIIRSTTAAYSHRFVWFCVLFHWSRYWFGTAYIRPAQVKVGLINLYKGLFSLNARMYYKLNSGT
jgi:hypothetical protein